MKINKRVFVSFDEPCLYQCKHCYTYGIKRDKIRSVENIVSDLSNEDFDIIYVSQKNDNFSEPLKGIDLCRELFKKYTQNIFIITRNAFNDTELAELINLKREINKKGKHLFIAISLNAIDSIHVSENTDKVCTPERRMDFIKKLGENGFLPILMLRPVFPDSIIPVKECLEIVEKVQSHISCVVTSGLGVNDDVLYRLGMKATDFKYIENQEYLDGAIDCQIKFVDVIREVDIICNKCKNLNIQVFAHSMTALNYVAECMLQNTNISTI